MIDNAVKHSLAISYPQLFPLRHPGEDDLGELGKGRKDRLAPLDIDDLTIVDVGLDPSQVGSGRTVGVQEGQFSLLQLAKVWVLRNSSHNRKVREVELYAGIVGIQLPVPSTNPLPVRQDLLGTLRREVLPLGILDPSEQRLETTTKRSLPTCSRVVHISGEFWLPSPRGHWSRNRAPLPQAC